MCARRLCWLSAISICTMLCCTHAGIYMRQAYATAWLRRGEPRRAAAAAVAAHQASLVSALRRASQYRLCSVLCRTVVVCVRPCRPPCCVFSAFPSYVRVSFVRSTNTQHTHTHITLTQRHTTVRVVCVLMCAIVCLMVVV